VTAAIAEMLLQSEEPIHLLPACPTVEKMNRQGLCPVALFKLTSRGRWAFDCGNDQVDAGGTVFFTFYTQGSNHAKNEKGESVRLDGTLSQHNALGFAARLQKLCKQPYETSLNGAWRLLCLAGCASKGWQAYQGRPFQDSVYHAGTTIRDGSMRLL